MATTTPNFGWTVPTSTDLVKDGATAIETLGDGVDASFVGLKGGTTGQVLSKTSATDLAFTWVTTDDTNAIQNAIVDAKGDLIGATAADTPARLGVGANGTVLTADSAEATGLKWATPSGFTFAAYTPTYANLTVGNGTVTAKYAQNGKFVIVNYNLVWGSTTSMTSSVTFSLPVTATDTLAVGNSYLLDAATAEFMGQTQGVSTTTIRMIALQNGTNIASQTNSTFPFTFTTNDVIRWTLVYEAA